MDIQGIYIIENLVNHKVYIGSSVTVNRRLQKHKNDLRNNKHHSYKLQGSFNKHSEDKFSFRLLEQMYFPEEYSTIIKTQYLECVEQYYMDLYEAYRKGYNVAKKSDRPLHGGKEATLKGIETKRKNGTLKWTEEQKKKSSEYFKNNENQLIHLKKLREIRGIKKVYQYNLDGSYIDEFDSAIIASEKLKLRKNSIWQNCRGSSPKCVNFIFSYEKHDKVPPFIDTRTLKNRDNQGRFIKK